MMYAKNVGIDVASKLIVEYHYSHHMPSSIQYCCALTDDDGNPRAAIVFTIPATRWSEKVYELARLVRTPEAKVPLTMLISKAVRDLYKEKGCDLIVSFADSTQSHHGGVYQAASWNFHEQRKPSCDGFHIDGNFVPRRTCNHRYGTSSQTKVVEICASLGKIAIPHFDTGKYLYWRSLHKSGDAKAIRLGLLKQPYPKPLA